MPADTQTVLVRIRRNARGEEVWVTSGPYHGGDRLDVRVFYQDGDTGEYKPSRAGVSLPPEAWGQLMPYLAAALQAPIANFRLVTIYAAEWPSQDVLDRLSWREDREGANLWLVRPKDDDVFRGGVVTDGIQHVSAVQTYLDLKAQPERSKEAAEVLRAACLKWS